MDFVNWHISPSRRVPRNIDLDQAEAIVRFIEYLAGKSKADFQ